VVIDPRNPNILYAAGGNPVGLQIYKSTNGGLSWTALTSQGAVGFQPLFIDPQGALYMPTGSSLRKSTDGGANWIPVNLRLGAPLTSLAIDPQSTLYAGSNPLWKSTDTGGSWNPASVGIPQGYRVDALVVDPVNPTSLFAGVNFGDCEWTERPRPWRRLPDGICGARCAVQRHNHLDLHGRFDRQPQTCTPLPERTRFHPPARERATRRQSPDRWPSRSVHKPRQFAHQEQETIANHHAL
jgi:hypothetical protein